MALDINDPNTPTIYANVSHVIVGASDVAIFFANEFPGAGENVTSGTIRVIMTHDSFMRFVLFWQTRFDFLNTVYKGFPENLNDIANQDPEGFRVLMQHYFSLGQANTAPEVYSNTYDDTGDLPFDGDYGDNYDNEDDLDTGDSNESVIPTNA